MSRIRRREWLRRFWVLLVWLVAVVVFGFIIYCASNPVKYHFSAEYRDGGDGLIRVTPMEVPAELSEYVTTGKDTVVTLGNRDYRIWRVLREGDAVILTCIPQSWGLYCSVELQE